MRGRAHQGTLVLLLAGGCNELIGIHPLPGMDGGAGDAAPADSSLSPSDATLEIPDEEVILNPQLTGSVFRDFSDVFTFAPNDFSDGATMLDNAPRALVYLDAPFPVGLAVLAGREIIEVRADTSAFRHDFRPASANDTGPDALLGGVRFDEVWGQGPALVVSSSSPGAGDGLHKILGDWSITRLTTVDDVRSVEWDGQALYGTGSLGPSGYISVPSGMYWLSATTLGINRVVEFNAKDVRLMADGVLANVTTGNRVYYAPGGYGATFASLVLAGGDQPAETGHLLAISGEDTLVELVSKDASVPLARTDTPDWIWVDAVQVKEGPLAQGTSAIYVLESNRLLDRDRILVFVAAP